MIRGYSVEEGGKGSRSVVVGGGSVVWRSGRRWEVVGFGSTILVDAATIGVEAGSDLKRGGRRVDGGRWRWLEVPIAAAAEERREERVFAVGSRATGFFYFLIYERKNLIGRYIYYIFK